MKQIWREYEGCVATGESNTKAERGRECSYVGFKLRKGEALSLGSVNEEETVVVVVVVVESEDIVCDGKRSGFISKWSWRGWSNTVVSLCLVIETTFFIID